MCQIVCARGYRGRTDKRFAVSEALPGFEITTACQLHQVKAHTAGVVKHRRESDVEPFVPGYADVVHIHGASRRVDGGRVVKGRVRKPCLHVLPPEPLVLLIGVENHLQIGPILKVLAGPDGM